MKKNEVFLHHIIDEIEFVTSCVAGKKIDDLTSDETAKRAIEDEIENCILVIQDIETDRYVRIEFQNKLNILRKALNKI
jgi:hypothetical protein